MKSFQFDQHLLSIWTSIIKGESTDEKVPQKIIPEQKDWRVVGFGLLRLQRKHLIKIQMSSKNSVKVLRQTEKL